MRRPNGQVYRPRALADMADVDALRKLRAAGIPALLYGPPGTGKTALAEAAFGDLITLAGDGDTTVADFAGDYTQTDDGRYEFVYGPLVTAMTEGRPLLIDDATLISPKVLAVVYPAMDDHRRRRVLHDRRPQPRRPRRHPHRRARLPVQRADPGRSIDRTTRRHAGVLTREPRCDG